MRTRSIFALAALVLFPLQAAFADDVNITPGGGDYLVGRPLSVTAERSIDPEPEGFCGCDADNNPTDWVFTHDSISLYGDADSGGNVDTESTGTKNVYAHVTYHWNCPADSSTKETEGQDDAQAPFHIYNAGMEGPDVLDLETDGTFNAKKMPDDVAVSGDWLAEGGTPGNSSGSSFTTKWLEPGEWGISVTIEGVEFSRTVKVKPPSILITEVSFESDHGVMTKHTADFLDGSDGAYTKPDWKPTGVNNPVTHSRGMNVTMKLRITVSPSTLEPRNFQLKGTGATGLNFDQTVSLKGGDNFVEVTSTDTLSNEIKKLESSIDWEIELDGNFVGGTKSGTHKIYQLWAEPQGTVPTEKRISATVAIANGLSEKNQIIAKFGADVAGFGNFDPEAGSIAGGAPPLPPDLETAWLVLGGQKADCLTLVTAMQYCLDTTGIYNSQVRFVWPRHASWIGLDTNNSSSANVEKRVAGPTLATGLGFMSAGKLNWFQACCVIDGKWWMGGPGSALNSAYEVLKEVTEPVPPKRQVWADDLTTPVAHPNGTP